MSPDSGSSTSLLIFVKELSGRRIEQARKRARITQAQLSRDVGISMRWLREIEAGNPTSRLDDHVACAQFLGLSTGYIFLPLLFCGHEMEFPRELVLGDLAELERECIDLIAERNITRITAQLTPKWWAPSRAGAA